MSVSRDPAANPGFWFPSVRKHVNVSKRGHGIASYVISAIKTEKRARYIVHRYGTEESIPKDYRVKPVKEAYNSWKRNGNIDLYEGSAFVIRSLGHLALIPEWKEIDEQGMARCFVVDVNSIGGDTGSVFRYEWEWSSHCMFTGVNGKLSSSYPVTCPVNWLVLELSFARSYQFRALPKLILVDGKGQEKVIKKIVSESAQSPWEKRLIPNLDDDYCRLFKIEIPNPEVGHTYKVEWEK